jgi:hypothetical protein
MVRQSHGAIVHEATATRRSPEPRPLSTSSAKPQRRGYRALERDDSYARPVRMPSSNEEGEQQDSHNEPKQTEEDASDRQTPRRGLIAARPKADNRQVQAREQEG